MHVYNSLVNWHCCGGGVRWRGGTVGARSGEGSNQSKYIV